jgi:subtilisin family serine protease
MRVILVLVVSFLLSGTVFSQSAPNKYWIQFTDKNGSPYSIDNPEAFLSERAIDRRADQGIEVVEQDIPVNQDYIDQVLELGNVELLLRSKWFNAITIETDDLALVAEIEQLSIVSQVKSYKGHTKIKSIEKEVDVIDKEFSSSAYGPSYDQLEEINGEALHKYDYLGNGKLIYVCDGGYTNFTSVDAFNHLFDENRIVGTHDFVDGDENVYHGSSHGTWVMGTMAGVIPSLLIGTAPQASYFLARTEDVSSEFLIEEDNWVSAAEQADSIGADIITTSLSYTLFDSTDQDHSYEDLNGETSRIAIGAGIAAQKGMLIVVSAGNYYNQPWHYIGTPADAFGILAIGGITSDSSHSSFSSAGPSADGRVKPEVVARGTAAVTANAGNNGISYVNGTSFSAPIISGISASLWQAFPSASSVQLREAIIQSAHLVNDPNDMMGYGIPNFGKAMNYLQDLLGVAPSMDPVSGIIQRVYPNPFDDVINVELLVSGESTESGTITLYDSRGLKVYQISVSFNAGRPVTYILGTPNLAAGVYSLEYVGENSRESVKVVHL